MDRRATHGATAADRVRRSRLYVGPPGNLGRVAEDAALAAVDLAEYQPTLPAPPYGTAAVGRGRRRCQWPTRRSEPSTATRGQPGCRRATRTEARKRVGLARVGQGRGALIRRRLMSYDRHARMTDRQAELPGRSPGVLRRRCRPVLIVEAWPTWACLQTERSNHRQAEGHARRNDGFPPSCAHHSCRW